MLFEVTEENDRAKVEREKLQELLEKKREELEKKKGVCYRNTLLLAEMEVEKKMEEGE